MPPELRAFEDEPTSSPKGDLGIGDAGRKAHEKKGHHNNVTCFHEVHLLKYGGEIGGWLVNMPKGNPIEC